MWEALERRWSTTHFTASWLFLSRSMATTMVDAGWCRSAGGDATRYSSGLCGPPCIAPTSGDRSRPPRHADRDGPPATGPVSGVVRRMCGRMGRGRRRKAERWTAAACSASPLLPFLLSPLPPTSVCYSPSPILPLHLAAKCHGAGARIASYYFCTSFFSNLQMLFERKKNILTWH